MLETLPVFRGKISRYNLLDQPWKQLEARLGPCSSFLWQELQQMLGFQVSMIPSSASLVLMETKVLRA